MSGDALLLLCCDGSENAQRAARRAGDLFPRRRTLVLTVWQHTIMMGDYGWSGAPMLDYVELDRVSTEAAHRRSEEGLSLALDGGLKAEVLVAEATGPVWKTIIDTADEQDAAVIVMGSRGRSKVASALLGSVSSHVIHHAEQPSLVTPAQGTPWPHSRREGRGAGHRDHATHLRRPDPGAARGTVRIRPLERAGVRAGAGAAVSAGRIRPLGDDFYEATEPEPEG